MDENEKDKLSARIRDLELTLGQGNDALAATFRLTPVLNNLFGLLMALPVVTPEMIQQRLEVAPDAKVAIFRLRGQVAPWEIKIHNKRSVGYWIEPEDKARVRSLIDESALITAPIEITNFDIASDVTQESNGPEAV